MQLTSGDEGWEVVGFQEAAPPDGLVLIDPTGAGGPSGYRDPAADSTWRAQVSWRRERAWYPGLMAAGTLLFSVSFLFGPHGELASQMPMGFAFGFVAIPAWLVCGVLCAWWALALLRNRTTVTVADGRLSCGHGPVPVVREKSRSVDLTDVELFEVERRDPAFVVKNVSGPTWEVVARLVGGRRVPVVTRLPEERHALWLQRKLETMLV